jgi:hypothetical protein
VLSEFYFSCLCGASPCHGSEGLLRRAEEIRIKKDKRARIQIRIKKKAKASIKK